MSNRGHIWKVIEDTRKNITVLLTPGIKTIIGCPVILVIKALGSQHQALILN